ncbi:MAG: TRL domain-containing protein [Moraxellaceae bacterium]
MKKFALIGLASAAALLSGCMAPYSGGVLYNDYNQPLSVRDNATACNKRGEASMTNILGYVAIGDASASKAKQAGGITKVGTVDTKFTSILGIVGTTTTVVCGE